MLVGDMVVGLVLGDNHSRYLGNDYGTSICFSAADADSFWS